MTDSQKKKRCEIASRLLDRFEEDGEKFLGNLVTGDESWLPLFIGETKEKTREWRKPGEDPPLKVKPSRFAKKIMITVFWDSKGLILLEFHDSTIDADSYVETLKKLKKEIRKKRLGKNVILQQDNARPHTAKKTKKTIEKFKWELLEHPPYSPDLAPSDYYLFSPLKNYLSGIHYPNQEELEFAVRAWFQKQDLNFFRKGIEKLPKRWKLCQENNGEYFEKKKRKKKINISSSLKGILDIPMNIFYFLIFFHVINKKEKKNFFIF